jgi:hypothetical protein
MRSWLALAGVCSAWPLVGREYCTDPQAVRRRRLEELSLTRRVQAQQPGERLGPLDVNGEIVYDCDAISDGVAISVRTHSLSRKEPTH